MRKGKKPERGSQKGFQTSDLEDSDVFVYDFIQKTKKKISSRGFLWELLLFGTSAF